MRVKAKKRPKLAVWKFASCDGCQLSLLDCEDELLALTDQLQIAYFVEATRTQIAGPYDLSLVEGSITTEHDRARIQEVRKQSKFLVTIGACATSGGIQALRNFQELHVPYTNALHSVRKGFGAYFVGPMARFFHNSKRLPPRTLELVQSLKLGVETCKNPFQSILIRAVEVHFACEEAISILQRIDLKAERAHGIQLSQLKNAIGMACTEAPRGILYHRYQINTEGIIEEAKIVPPTSQNQKIIENDLRELVKKSIHLSKEKLTWICEQAVRNYDPCISCATHFLKLNFNHDRT